MDVDRDNPGRYCNISTDVTFADGTTQEISLLNSVEHSKSCPISKTYVVHQGNTDDLSSPSLTKPNYTVKSKHKPVNRIITKQNPFTVLLSLILPTNLRLSDSIDRRRSRLRELQGVLGKIIYQYEG